MSDPLRVAVVCEGPTDKIVIEAAIAAVLEDQPFILRLLQPEESVGFGHIRGGWPGVYWWCSQARTRAGGSLRNDPLFLAYDLLILHLDAEVAGADYAEAGIVDPVNDLPCVHPCPPAESSTNALRNVMVRWLGEPAVPPKTVFCTPSIMTEAWVLCALYRQDAAVTSGSLECFPRPDNALQAKSAQGRLITGGRKIVRMYQVRSAEITAEWNQVRIVCSEAERFSMEFSSAIGLGG